MTITRKYEDKDLIVSWEADLCNKAAECVKGAPDVFKPNRRPWVDLSQDTSEHIMEVIDKCPTKALKYERK